MSEQQAHKLQEDDDSKYARVTAREEAEYDALLAQVLAESIADVPEDVLEAIRAMEASEKEETDVKDAVIPADSAAAVSPVSETAPHVPAEVDPDFAIALALQEEEDRVLAKAPQVTRFGGGPSRYDGDYHSRLRQDERYHAAKEEYVVATAADLPRRTKGKHQRGSGPTKHDPVICGRQNAKYLERRYGDEMGTLAAGQKVDNPTFNSLRTFLGRRRGKRAVDVSHVGDAESENVVRRLKASGDISNYSFLSYGSDATLYRVSGWRAPCHVASSVAAATSMPDSDQDSGSDYVMVSGVEDVKSVDTSLSTTPSVSTTTTHRLNDVIIKVFRLGADEYTARVEALSDDHKLKRDKYSRQYAKKLAKHCAQAEYNNLSALHSAQVPVPQPLFASGNILVMSGVITESGKPALPLNSTHLSPSELKSAYTQSLQIVNDAFAKARTVICTLNEGDLLWKDGSVVLIDVPVCTNRSEVEENVLLDALTEVVYNITKYFEELEVDVLPYHVVTGVITNPPAPDAAVAVGSKVSPFVQTLRQLLRERKLG